MKPEQARVLRECAVDLIRASDLSDDLAIHRVGLVSTELSRLIVEIGANDRLETVFRLHGEKLKAVA